ncbi:hypothetical protein Ahia01_000482900 [Argonauta hians]
MAFLESCNANERERFSPLDLEPGEIYFEEFAVIYYPPSTSETDAINRQQRGKLKICSKSVVFEPKETKYSLIKFPLKNVKNLGERQAKLFSKIDIQGKTFFIESSLTVRIKEKNIVSPFVYVKGPDEHIFRLVYTTVNACLSHIAQLHRASTLDKIEQASMINTIVLARQSKITFDASCLEDFHEKRLIEKQAERITPLVTTPGRVVLTDARIYFQPFSSTGPMSSLKIQCKHIQQVVKRRFLLRHVGVEILCSEKASLKHLYLTLKNQAERDELYENIISFTGLDVESMEQENVILKWQTGLISNYDYLLYLNRMADRSFNDLTQYPVMPWVIADHHSTNLDLTKESTFRDLSKPIGALNSERLAKLRERYDEMPEPKFLFGSHYSTPCYVLFYLSRVALEYSLCLHGGRFDQPDRMFNSIAETWYNCLHGASDFKELIPEFYDGDGEFLYNRQNINFGVRQNGRQVGDVELPPWADDPKDFIGKMRSALECDWVSRHLHQWIDLIFGYKQVGYEAEAADNVFYYLTYEGSVNVENIDDINERNSYETQIMEFGQTPKQLFTEPHPRRYHIDNPYSILPSPTHVFVAPFGEDSAASFGESSNGQSSGNSSDSREWQTLQPILSHCLHKDCILDVHLSPDGKYIFSTSKDVHFKMYSVKEKHQARSINLCNMTLSQCIPVNDNKMVIVSSWDNSIYFYSIEYGRIVDTLFAHEDAVSSLLVSGDKLISSSWDSDVKVWHYSSSRNFRLFSQECLVSLEHDSSVYCMSAAADGSLLATGTKDGGVWLWQLCDYYLLKHHRCHKGRVNSVIISPDKTQLYTSGCDGYFKILDSYSGIETFSKKMEEEIRCMSRLDGFLIFGSSAGSVCVWDPFTFRQVDYIPDAHHGAVTSLHVQGRTIVTGGEDGRVVLWQQVTSSFTPYTS